MAELKGIPFIGSLGTLTAYKRRDSDKIILRGKGGPSKEDFRSNPNFDITRQNLSEFGGRSKTSKGIRVSLELLPNLADHNISASLNTVLRPVQLLDKISLRGERKIELSKYSHFLEGFNFNRKNPFDSIVRSRVQFSIDRESLSAKLVIPELVTGVNLFNPNQHPLFGFYIALGVVPDYKFYKDLKAYMMDDPGNSPQTNGKSFDSEWYPSATGCDSMEIELKLPKAVTAPTYTLVLGIGIKYATLGNAAVVTQVEYGGSAKIIGALGVY